MVEPKRLKYSNTAIVGEAELRAAGHIAVRDAERRLRASLADKPGVLLRSEEPVVIDGRAIGVRLTYTKYPRPMGWALLRRHPERFTLG
jgi:hypothetical protein